jgi:hypothetical protein
MSDQCRFALSNIVRHPHAAAADVAVEVEVDTDLPLQRLRLKGRMASLRLDCPIIEQCGTHHDSGAQ